MVVEAMLATQLAAVCCNPYFGGGILRAAVLTSL